MRQGDNMIYDISVVQGDDIRLNFSIKFATGTQYTFKTGDKVLFTVRPKIKDDIVIVKEVTVDEPTANVAINLAPSDTGTLKCGDYVYDAKLINAGSTHTFIPFSKLTVKPSVG